MRIPKWDKLDREQRDLYVTVLWKDGFSERAIAHFLRTTKGRIVVHRQRVLQLKTGDRPFVRSIVDPERFRDLLDLHAMEQMEARGIAVIAPISPLPTEQKTVHTSCQWPLLRGRALRATPCGKPAVEGHNLCREHLAEVSHIARPFK